MKITSPSTSVSTGLLAKLPTGLCVAVTCLCLSFSTQARDERTKFSIADALNSAKAKGVLDQGYQYKFGNQSHGSVTARYGEFTSNKKTNAFAKSDEQACQWAFLSALASFQNRIETEGGNAVINIRSYYKSNEFSSTTEYECGAGNVVAGVTFKGEVVKLAN